MEEDEEDDLNTIISFPRMDGVGAWHGMGRAWVRGLPGGGAGA